MTKDLIKTIIAEYQQYVTGVKLIPRQMEFMDGQNYLTISRHPLQLLRRKLHRYTPC